MQWWFLLLMLSDLVCLSTELLSLCSDLQLLEILPLLFSPDDFLWNPDNFLFSFIGFVCVDLFLSSDHFLFNSVNDLLNPVDLLLNSDHFLFSSVNYLLKSIDFLPNSDHYFLPNSDAFLCSPHDLLTGPEPIKY